MGLQAIPTRHQDSDAHRQRIAEVVNGVTSFQFDDSRVRTLAEIDAGVTPVNYAYAPGMIDRYGTNSIPGTTDMASALVAAIASMSAAGGGTVTALPGVEYKIAISSPSAGLVISQNVGIDLNGATLKLSFAAGSSSLGLDLRDYSFIRNGRIIVDTAGDPASANATYLANIIVGAVDGSLVGYGGWVLENLYLDNNRADITGGTLIYVSAGSYNGIINNITVPDSTVLGAGIRVSWSGDGGSPNPTLSAHPNNIRITNIHGGSYTRAATEDVAFIDIVGAYNIEVDNVRCTAWAGDSVAQVRVGAFGTAVAPSDDVPMLNRNIRIANISCSLAKVSLVQINGRGHGGGAIAAANYPMGVEVVGITSVGAAGSATSGTAGFKVAQTPSGSTIRLSQFDIQQHYRGVYIEENANGVFIGDGRTWKNQQDGVLVTHGSAPADVWLARITSYLNGQDGGNFAGFNLGKCTRVTCEDLTAGDASSETTQFYGFKVDSTAVATRFCGRNRVRNIKGGGVQYSFSAAISGDRFFSGGSNGLLSATTTEWLPLQGVVAPVAAEVDASILCPSDMVLTNFKLLLSVAPTGATKSRELRIVNDGGATALDITLTDAATSGSDYDAVEVTAGTQLSVQSLVANTPAASRAKWSCEGFLK